MTPPATSAERVKAARELLGLSQVELAGAAGVSQALISQIERGQRSASELTLRAIARGTGLPWSFFTKQLPELPDDSLRFRKFRTAPAKDATRARRTFKELFGAAVALMEWGRVTPVAFPLPDAANGDGAEIEEIAAATRSSLAIPRGEPIRHLTRTLERSGIAVAPIVFAELDDDEAFEVAAIGHFGLSARTVHAATVAYFPSPGDRQRFTLAHELGHLVLHDGRTSAGQEEHEADLFAGALLMPRENAVAVLKPQLTLRDFAHLKASWGISIQALIMRAHHLGIIDDERRTSLYKQISARGWRRNEPVVVRNEEPALLGTLLARRFGTGSHVYTSAALEMGLPAVQLRSMMPPPNTRSAQAEEVEASVTPLRRTPAAHHRTADNPEDWSGRS